jgi:tRNA (guanine37-N1)-methyltransferase
MWFGVVSLFPEMFAALDYGIPGKAKKQGAINVQYWNPRDFTTDSHRTVDDRPYGGGPGMVMMAPPLKMAIDAAKTAANGPCKTVYLSPQGRHFDYHGAQELLKNERLILLCGRYEGIDERIIATAIDEEWSLGDYVLSGGELAAMVLIDAITRLLPGVLGSAQSATQDSFVAGLLDYPHYTRPENFSGLSVPEVLKSGNHEQIRRWRLQQALVKTWQKRPDLLAKLQLTLEEQELLKQALDRSKQS